MKCVLCGGPVSLVPYVEVTGWAKKRRKGGLHALRGRKQTGRVACDVCVTKLHDGVPLDQMTLPL